jgi:hypothetical protein
MNAEQPTPHRFSSRGFRCEHLTAGAVLREDRAK